MPSAIPGVKEICVLCDRGYTLYGVYTCLENKKMIDNCAHYNADFTVCEMCNADWILINGTCEKCGDWC